MRENEIKEKIAQDWIKSSMWFEVMATDKELTENSLKEHIEKVKSVENSYMLEEKFHDIQEVNPPPRDIKQAFSKIVEIKLLTKNIETLLFIVISFAPSSIEILEPKDLKIGIDSLQAILNSVSDVMHRLASQGPGGIIIATKR